MIEALTGFPARVLAFACKGHVTKGDYETVLIPAVEKALQQPGKVRLYYEVDFTGIDAGAMWDDLKVGMEHPLRWERIAIVTDVDWIRYTLRAFSFLMPGVAKIFRRDEKTKAQQWILDGVETVKPAA